MKNRACRATDGDGKKVHAKTEIAKDCKNWESVSERERDQRRQTKTSREGRMRESVRQRGTNRYRDNWTAEIRRRRGSDCPPSPPLCRLRDITHITGERVPCSILFHLHINGFLLITARAACVSWNRLYQSG